MKTSTLIPVVAYLGLAGYTAAAPVNVESTNALDKRTFCFFGIGWGCNTAPAPAPAPAPKPATSSVVPSKAAVSSSAVKSSAVASSSAKVVSSAAASSSAKAVVPTSASATKVSSANWAQCTDFDWNSWGSDWTWGGGFDKDYVKSWYVAEYGFAPPQGMNWKQVSSLVSKFGQKTKPASPKTTSKFTGKGCSNPWTSAVTKTAVQTGGPAVTSVAASKPAVTSAAASSAVVSKASSSAAAASSAAVSKPASSAAASSASASVSKPVASSSSSAVVVAPASSAAASSAAASSAAASSAVVVAPASSAAASSAAASSSAVVVAPAPASSAAASSAPAASSDVSSSADASPLATSAAASSDAAPVASSSAAVPSPSPSADATSASSAAASPSAGTGSGSSDGSAGSPGTGSGSSDGSNGTPGTGAGVPGTGSGSNTATGTTTSDAPAATTSTATVINGFTYGGCVQEVSNRLLAKVQTSSPSMTIEMCTATCDSYGYAVAGVEYGSECYCGTLADIENTSVSGECKMVCSGDSSEICGGPNAINIYIDASNVPATVNLPAGWTTYGVVTEGQNGRVLPVQILNDQTNTVEVCANACAAAGYLIAGTEYSSECYCGNAFVAAANGGQLVDDSAAFMTCPGNGGQKCGGPSILSVTSAYGNNIPSA